MYESKGILELWNILYGVPDLWSSVALKLSKDSSTVSLWLVLWMCVCACMLVCVC